MGLSRRAVIAGAGLAAAGCSTYGKPPSTPTQNPTGELVKTSAVPPGGGVIIGDKQVVVTQPQQGTFKAFSAICTHQGCTVANVQGETINCECHGSKYNIADGSVAEGPATQPLAEKKISVQGDAIRLE
ncbi:iron-sulfur protein [Lentzea sp. NBRC 105346]|uniref:Rieske (2Fe-2S) protein n=1 Tax=Lentzea sp. NBRC 105346 TaxID=3032205 RepID=UPI0024A43CAD|nr:Rieske (2Fe-2S) protein [Lentzea sp. NBRC 105346]GLZ29911.1 iron-sulfur protein [Lentzea sp. NBRC 105346]